MKLKLTSPIWGYLGLLAVTLAAYWPVFHAGFIWNDDSFLTANPLIKAPDGLYRYWFTQQAPDYWPLTSTSLWLEWRLWGMHAAGYHATNLLLHLGSVILLWRILLRLEIPGAWLGAMLFAVHPVNVESVAWITQRKNLLAMLFYLISIRCFLAAGPRHWTWYWSSVAAFALAMLSKASVAPLPLVLIALAWAKGVRLRRGAEAAARRFRAEENGEPPLLPLLRNLTVSLGIPFLAIAAGFIAINFWFQSHGAGAAVRSFSALQRILGAGAAIWFYLGKALWPAHLSFVYPQWRIDARDPRWWLPLLAALALTAWLAVRPRWRAGLLAWSYYCLLLLPVLGLTDVYYFKYSPVADHYQHLALIGVTTLAGAVLYQWFGSGLRQWVPAVLITACSLLTYRRGQLFRDDAALSRATLAINPNAALIHNNVGNQLMNSGRVSEALPHFETAVRLLPDFPEAENDWGAALVAEERLPNAITHFRRALQLRPGFAEADYNLGLALRDSGQKPEALFRFSEAVRLWPDYIKALNALGLAFYDAGRWKEAVPCYEHALAVDPKYADVLNNLGCALLKLNRVPEAVDRFEAAARLNYLLPDLPYNLGVALARSGRRAESAAQFEEAVKRRPGDADTRRKLAQVLWSLGRKAEATFQLEQAKP